MNNKTLTTLTTILMLALTTGCNTTLNQEPTQLQQKYAEFYECLNQLSTPENNYPKCINPCNKITRQ